MPVSVVRNERQIQAQASELSAELAHSVEAGEFSRKCLSGKALAAVALQKSAASALPLTF